MLILSDPVFLANAHFLALAGLVVILLEFILPTKGALGLTGAVMFLAGTLSLTNSPSDFWHLSWPMFCILNVLVLGGLLVIALILALNYTKTDQRTTAPHIGQSGHVIEWTKDSKRIEVGGAIWQAKSTKDFQPGDKITVTAQHNLVLTVTPFGENA
jgi:membrane-bound ClpP family serine protease